MNEVADLIMSTTPLAFLLGILIAEVMDRVRRARRGNQTIGGDNDESAYGDDE